MQIRHRKRKYGLSKAVNPGVVLLSTLHAKKLQYMVSMKSGDQHCVDCEVGLSLSEYMNMIYRNDLTTREAGVP